MHTITKIMAVPAIGLFFQFRTSGTVCLKLWGRIRTLQNPACKDCLFKRHSSTSSSLQQLQEASQDLTSEEKSLQLTASNERRPEKFIPLTRRALLRLLLEDRGLLQDSGDKRSMSSVAAALDAKYSKMFYSILEQSKVSALRSTDEAHRPLTFPMALS